MAKHKHADAPAFPVSSTRRRTPPGGGRARGQPRHQTAGSAGRSAPASMTARRQTLERAAAQEGVIAALLATGHLHVADRLGRCMAAMVSRRNGGGYPWTCRGAGCAWCGKTRARRWWLGLRRWTTSEGGPVSLAVLPLRHRPGGLRTAVARLRRALRDVRDRAARRRPSWGSVALAGMATGDGAALLLINHTGIPRAELTAVLRKRWPEVAVVDADAPEPSWSMSTEDAAELARIRRGVEPLRIVVLPQRAADAEERGRGASAGGAAAWLEPMPIAF